jgi:hypothetical protein
MSCLLAVNFNFSILIRKYTKHRKPDWKQIRGEQRNISVIWEIFHAIIDSLAGKVEPPQRLITPFS